MQAGDPDSMLELYRAALRLRHAEPALGDGPMHWLPSPDGVLAFARGDLCRVANLSPAPVALPAHTAALLASGPFDDGLLPRHRGLAPHPPRFRGTASRNGVALSTVVPTGPPLS